MNTADAFRQLRAQLRNLETRIAARFQAAGDRLSEDEARMAQLARYVDDMAGRMYRADLVDVLPESAPAGKLLVMGGDPNVYVGTGPSPRPLRKIPTQPL